MPALILFLSFPVLALTPDRGGNDRVCGVLRVIPQAPPSCVTCTMAPDLFFLEADQINGFQGSVPLAPHAFFLLENSVQGDPNESPSYEPDHRVGMRNMQIRELKNAMLYMAVPGKRYCATGLWGKAVYPDERIPAAKMAINFRRLSVEGR